MQVGNAVDWSPLAHSLSIIVDLKENFLSAPMGTTYITGRVPINTVSLALTEKSIKISPQVYNFLNYLLLDLPHINEWRLTTFTAPDMFRYLVLVHEKDSRSEEALLLGRDLVFKK